MKTCKESPCRSAASYPTRASDGGERGQAYRLRFDLEGRDCLFALRAPDESGAWPSTWTEPQLRLPLPDPVVERLMQGAVLAPTLREIAEPDASRYVVLDLIIEVPVPELPESAQIQRVLGWDWGVRTLVTATVLDLAGNRLSPPLFLDTGGFDGRQARTRRHIDRLKGGANPPVAAGCAGALTPRSEGRCGAACATNATWQGSTWPGSIPGGPPTPAPTVASLPSPMPHPLSTPKCSRRDHGCAVLPVAGMGPGTMPPLSISRS
jgi:hypothetical protein